MLRLSGVSVFLDGNIIDLGVTQLQVVEACSGLRYLMPLFLLALLIGYFFTKGWWRNGVLVVLVVPLSVFFNSLRIWMSGILTVKGHPELVENFFQRLLRLGDLHGRGGDSFWSNGGFLTESEGELKAEMSSKLKAQSLKISIIRELRN